MSDKSKGGMRFRPLNSEPEPMAEGSDLAEENAPDLGGGHLDGITVEEVEGTIQEAGIDGGEAPSAVIGREEFHAMFCGVFNMAHAVTRLQSLAVDRDSPTARPCTEAIYDIAEETPSLRWLIEPGNVWMQRAFAIGAFAVPMGVGVAGELKARAAVKKSASRPVNDNTQAASNDNIATMEMVGVPVG